MPRSSRNRVNCQPAVSMLPALVMAFPLQCPGSCLNLMALEHGFSGGGMGRCCYATVHRCVRKYAVGLCGVRKEGRKRFLHRCAFRW